MDVPCGLTTLMVLEIFYLIYFFILIMGLMVVGAAAKGLGSLDNGYYNYNGSSED
jgi:hypothetical protein